MGAGLKTVEELRLTDAERDLVAANIGIAIDAASQIMDRYPNLDPSVVRATCEDSLMRAVKTWDATKGKLSTYFWGWTKLRVHIESHTQSLATIGPAVARRGEERYPGDEPEKRLAKRRSINGARDLADPRSVMPADAVIASEQHIVNKDLASRLLDRLSPRQRESVELCLMQGLTSEAAAERTGRCKQAVNYTKLYGLNRLREIASREGIAWRA